MVEWSLWGKCSSEIAYVLNGQMGRTRNNIFIHFRDDNENPIMNVSFPCGINMKIL